MIAHVEWPGGKKPQKKKMTIFLDINTVKQVHALARVEKRSLSNMLACLIERQIEQIAK